MKKVQTIVENKEFLVSVLSGALDYSPWALCDVHDDTAATIYESAAAANVCREDFWADVLLNGGALSIEDCESGVFHKVTLKDFVKAFKKLIFAEPRYYADIMTESADMWAYDGLLQTAVFGKVIYG